MAVDSPRFQVWSKVWDKSYPSGIRHQVDVDRTALVVMISSHTNQRADGLIFTQQEWREIITATQGLWAMPEPPEQAR